jgi:hypothetical protein
MDHRIRPIVMLALLSYLIFHPSSLARADGGAVRVRQRAGGYQIAVFTSPTPFRAGPVDVSVLVQDDATGECVPGAQVTVRLKAIEDGRILEFPATTAAATNRLFHAAVFELPEVGRWDVEVAVEGPHGRALLRFGIEADGPAPRWLELWPWFTWPALVAALFGLHQLVIRRRPVCLPARRRVDVQVTAMPDVRDDDSNGALPHPCASRAADVTRTR